MGEVVIATQIINVYFYPNEIEVCKCVKKEMIFSEVSWSNACLCMKFSLYWYLILCWLPFVFLWIRAVFRKMDLLKSSVESFFESLVLLSFSVPFPSLSSFQFLACLLFLTFLLFMQNIACCFCAALATYKACLFSKRPAPMPASLAEAGKLIPLRLPSWQKKVLIFKRRLAALCGLCKQFSCLEWNYSFFSVVRVTTLTVFLV